MSFSHSVYHLAFLFVCFANPNSQKHKNRRQKLWRAERKACEISERGSNVISTAILWNALLGCPSQNTDIKTHFNWWYIFGSAIYAEVTEIQLFEVFKTRVSSITFCSISTSLKEHQSCPTVWLAPYDFWRRTCSYRWGINSTPLYPQSSSAIEDQPCSTLFLSVSQK